MRRPRPLRHNATIYGLLALLAASACGDPLSPGDVAGTYVLRFVQGERLPTVLWRADEVRVVVLADTLRLDADGRGYLVRVSSVTGPTRASTAPMRQERPFSYLLDGRALSGEYLCPPGSFCLGIVERFGALLTRGGLWVVRALNERVPLEYERIHR